MKTITTTKRAILEEILEERYNQERQWGEQNHHPEKWLIILMEEVGEVAEAVLEAFPHTHQLKTKEYWLDMYRRELIQTAAVAVAAVESIDRMEEND